MLNISTNTHMNTYIVALLWIIQDAHQEVVQVAGDVENRPPLHEPHVLWILLVADYEADACNLF